MKQILHIKRFMIYQILRISENLSLLQFPRFFLYVQPLRNKQNVVVYRVWNFFKCFTLAISLFL